VATYDVDHFKAINDSHFHAMGDVATCEIAWVVSAALRETDVDPRHGGEEFALILPSTTLDEAARVMEKVRALVAGHDWHANAPELSITISAGVAAADRLRDADDDGDRLFARADAKLDEAKRTGRNRVCF
jgi:diguanylate cyclase (GGDEF)-like protein